jgi:DNA-binding CsgD family transcriptional regulator
MPSIDATPAAGLARLAWLRQDEGPMDDAADDPTTLVAQPRSGPDALAGAIGAAGPGADPSLAVLGDWIARNGTATVLLGPDGRLILMNPVAERIARREDAVQIDASGIHALRPRDDEALQQMILRTARHGRYAGEHGATAMRLARRLGGRDYLVQVAHFGSAPRVGGARHGFVCVLIWDPDGANALDPAMLKAMFRMTPAEIRLALQLVAGKTTEQAAAELGVALTTARYHLARLYRKTQTQRQSELVTLLHQLASSALCP